MKKSLIIAAALTLGAVASQAQGLVSISLTGGALCSTNSSSGATGLIQGTGTAGYYFELLTSANTALPSSDNLIANYQGGTENASALAVWTDTGVTGASQSSLNKGKISAAGTATANGWAAPSGATYDDTQSYIIVGWSGNYGTTYSAFLSSLNGGLAAGGYFGVTALDLNVAGGGPSSLSAVNMWGNQTGGTGLGNSAGLVLNQVVVVPEPGTIAMAALGGLSLLAFRRKK